MMNVGGLFAIVKMVLLWGFVLKAIMYVLSEIGLLFMLW